MAPAPFDETFDYVVVGAGSAGCAVAARLTQAGHTVLLLEAGGVDQGSRWLRIPLGVGRINRDPRYVWQFEAEADPATGNRRFYWPRGKLLGGSSSVNGMIWVRGDPRRYDEWAASGAPGWAWRDIEPMLRRIEGSRVGDSSTRGRTGPIAVEEIGRGDPITDAFVAACQGAGIPANPDYNGTLGHEGASYLQSSTRNGARCSAATGYLRPLSGDQKLKVATESPVRRILFDGRHAVGVAYRSGEREIRAAVRREVILAAGAIQSPQLLELSGIGDGRHLGRLGIPVVHDLPGVGENLSDHFHIRLTYRARNTVTVNDLLRRPWLHGPRAWLEYAVRSSGLFAGATATAHALARSTPERPYPDFKLQLHKISVPDRTAENGAAAVDPYCGVSIGYFQLYPESRGSIHVTSTDPAAPPRIVANYLAAEADRRAAVTGLRLGRRIAAQAPLARFLIEETRPGPDLDDDATLLDYARRNGQTSYHPVGTCRMGNDALAVVDAECRVRGVGGLRVADAAVMPFIVSSNTNAPSIAIGERAAQLILGQSNQPAAA